MTKALEDMLRDRPKIMVDREYYYLIQKDSELLEYLQLHGVEDWEGYKAAEQECNHEVGGE